MKLYKVLGTGHVSCHGGSGKWRKNVWRSVRGPLVACKNGIHLCRREDLIHWLGEEIWEAEGTGGHLLAENKTVWRKARMTKQLTAWNERTARLFAADCAEKACQDINFIDERVLDTIRKARLFADGKISRDARSAAWSAAQSAAESAAWSAAESAAQSAAWSAAQSAAWSAARSWQTERLFHYLKERP